MYTLNKESTEIQQIIKTLGYATCAYQQERIEEEKTEWVSDESFAGKKGVCVWGGGGNESEEHRVPVTTLLLMLQDRRKGKHLEHLSGPKHRKPKPRAINSC